MKQHDPAYCRFLSNRNLSRASVRYHLSHERPYSLGKTPDHLQYTKQYEITYRSFRSIEERSTWSYLIHVSSSAEDTKIQSEI